jgi:hypothetical protein
MSRLNIAVEQPIGGCQWSHPGHRLTCISDERDQPENLWVCLRRAGKQRGVSEYECAVCAYWEAESAAAV